MGKRKVCMNTDQSISLCMNTSRNEYNSQSEPGWGSNHKYTLCEIDLTEYALQVVPYKF